MPRSRQIFTARKDRRKSCHFVIALDLRQLWWLTSPPARGVARSTSPSTCSATPSFLVVGYAIAVAFSTADGAQITTRSLSSALAAEQWEVSREQQRFSGSRP